jgi:hypothetical protein
VVGRQVSNYWNEEPYTEEWGFGDGPQFSIFYFPYRLEDYVNGLCAAGFRIERFHEPRPSAALAEAHPEIGFATHFHHHTGFVLFIAAAKR